MSHYRITPLEKKSINCVFDLYRRCAKTGEIQSLVITETYRWGHGFIEGDADFNLPYSDAQEAYCRYDAGENESCDLEDCVYVNYEFDDAVTPEERDEIEKQCYENGVIAWVHDGDHDWEVEEEYMVIYAPFTVELCNEDGEVIEIPKLEPRPQPTTTWPFPEKGD